MKDTRLLVLEKMVRWMAKQVLHKYQPKIVAITGSVGKTTTKEMIGTMLSSFSDVRKSERNYNNEIGIPLTILGSSSPGGSLLGWLWIGFKWIGLMVVRHRYPAILVLEMGADHPGDIKYLTSFVPVQVGVLTNIGISHLEHFKTMKEVAKEKAQLVKSVPSNGLAVLNYDNEECRHIAEQLGSHVILYGFSPGAEMRASDVVFGYQHIRKSNGEELSLIRGLMFKLNYKGKIIPVRLNYCLGNPAVYAGLAACATAVWFDLNLLEAAEALADVQPPPGRMNLLSGIKQSMIIDDSYNSAPDSVAAALETLAQIKARRKIVVLGDMLELGDQSVSAHEMVGIQVGNLKPDFFVVVGDRMRDATRAFIQTTGRNDSVKECSSPDEAGRFIQHMITQGDLLLVKGSQGMRMEKVVEEIMAEPERAGDLLVRQDSVWKERHYVKP